MEGKPHRAPEQEIIPPQEVKVIDAFDSLFEESTPSTPQPAPAREYEVLAEGVHDLEIVAASVGEVAWKASDENPQGQCLRLRLSAGRGIAFVFVDIGREKKWLFKALAASLGLEPGPDGRLSIGPPEQLIGRRVRVEVGRYRTRAGETRANVKRWLPAAPVPSTAAPASTTSRSSNPAKAAACRTPAAKAAAVFRESAADDEFPF
jgi:hypothetical protein